MVCFTLTTNKASQKVMKKSGFTYEKDLIIKYEKECPHVLYRKKNIALEKLKLEDIDEIVAAFQTLGWNKPRFQYESYYNEQLKSEREVMVAKLNDQFVGYVTLKWKSEYKNFSENNIPEICDLNVLPEFRKQGIGTRLISECEKLVKDKNYLQIGLGVGLLINYGHAQRLYIKLGYIPDGQGIFYKNKPVGYLEEVVVDDDLVIYLTKTFYARKCD